MNIEITDRHVCKPLRINFFTIYGSKNRKREKAMRAIRKIMPLISLGSWQILPISGNVKPNCLLNILYAVQRSLFLSSYVAIINKTKKSTQIAICMRVETNDTTFRIIVARKPGLSSIRSLGPISGFITCKRNV